MENQRQGEAILAKRQIKANPQYKKTVMVEIDIRYPQITVRDNAAVTARISGYYKLVAQKYYSFIMQKLYPDAVKDYISRQNANEPFHSYSATSDFEVTYNQNGFLSIYYDIYEFTGGAHGNTTRHADTWNIETGKHVQLYEFFTSSSYKNIIYSAVFAQMSQGMSTGDTAFFENYQKNVFKYFDDNNFYLTPGGLAVYFPLYTIAPYAAGILAFTIPYPEFGSLLKAPMK